MSWSKVMWIFLVVAIVALGHLSAFAIPVRQSSGNGQSSGVENWMLLGQTGPVTLTANGDKIKVTREVICPQQDQSDGYCSSGNYMFLFQIQSTSTNVPINIGKLSGFTEVGGNGTGTYGVMVCDDANNDAELCTEDPGDPTYANIPNITFKVKSKTAVTFTVPSFPAFPAGNSAEGQGLTLFIVTQQSSASPIAYPTIGD